MSVRTTTTPALRLARHVRGKKNHCISTASPPTPTNRLSRLGNFLRCVRPSAERTVRLVIQTLSRLSPLSVCLASITEQEGLIIHQNPCVTGATLAAIAQASPKHRHCAS
ncbi:hypothetical protein K504DRAFT_448264 [Pleomassaria siparia CBS 279.74]|uniref:Uncharacterized protein n=1 Tax=Pleomassaria siparia CBS 279.74 TaxID=1314801 RepID=A0A6G1JYX7_9PLEO|nr:hypothetical protein K504DRAFT_448264 [Pleomassaria siparia CBS 279.74]